MGLPVTDSSRYTFSCPSCAGSFGISLEKIPPVRARFACPKCGKAMDFPSREEARVYLQLQADESASTPPPPEPPPPEPPPPPPAAAPRPTPAPRAAETPARPPAVAAAPAAPPANPPDAEKRYVVNKAGFENDSYDRRAMRNLIRTGALNENDVVLAGGRTGVRADAIPELKSLFELRKTARTTPPPVCRKHTEVLAHYVCGDTGRPLCDECAPEKKFGGTSIRVCEHCAGTARDLHQAPGDLT
jgi:predicted Zn finger-like uncharacterized protein